MATNSILRKTAVAFGACLLLLAAQPTHPQSSGGVFELRAHVLDAGGRSSGGVYSVQGVIGQAVVGTSSGGSFSASGGFLRSRAPLPDGVFANGFE